MTDAPILYSGIVRLAVPIILANSATPLLGLVDTAVIGHVARAEDLGGVALGALIFSFIYWGFGFLRMSTSGFVAQAQGRDDQHAIQLLLLRALLLGVGIGVFLILLQWPLKTLALTLLGASTEVEQITSDYFAIRIWSAPACLANYVLAGMLIGSGKGRQLLVMQLLLNGLNILFDILFAGFLKMGASGIALGTVLAEWITFALAGWGVAHSLQMALIFRLKNTWSTVLDRSAISGMLRANGDIMVRTLLLLAGFGIFNDQGARFGDLPLAANHILLQFISFSAFFLDGFAFVTESLAGKAFGAKQLSQFNIINRRTTVLAAITALLLSLVLLSFGPPLINALTQLEQVNQIAQQYLPFAAFYILVSFVTFQLDGIFIGCTATRHMRNGAIISILAFVGMCYPAVSLWGNTGLWLAFIGFVIIRALSLGVRLPTLKREGKLS